MKKQIKIISAETLSKLEQESNEFLNGFYNDDIIDTEFYCTKYSSSMYFYVKITFLKP